MESLNNQNCAPCEGGIDPLSDQRVARLLPQVPEWSLSEDALGIERNFAFDDFEKGMAFVNALAWLANQQGHHPDFRVGFNYCQVRFTTHAINGLSENDFICAAKLNALYDTAMPETSE